MNDARSKSFQNRSLKLKQLKQLDEKAFIRTNIVLLVLFRKQTTGITSHYLQARLRNILQEEWISSRCSKPPYLLKGISSLVALKDTCPAPFLGKDQWNLHAKMKWTFGCKPHCQKLVQASPVSVGLEGKPWRIITIRARRTTPGGGPFYLDNMQLWKFKDQLKEQFNIWHTLWAVCRCRTIHQTNPWCMHPHIFIYFASWGVSLLKDLSHRLDQSDWTSSSTVY